MASEFLGIPKIDECTLLPLSSLSKITIISLSSSISLRSVINGLALPDLFTLMISTSKFRYLLSLRASSTSYFTLLILPLTKLECILCPQINVIHSIKPFY